jgi:hypothetical protein
MLATNRFHPLTATPLALLTLRTLDFLMHLRVRLLNSPPRKPVESIITHLWTIVDSPYLVSV